MALAKPHITRVAAYGLAVPNLRRPSARHKVRLERLAFADAAYPSLDEVKAEWLREPSKKVGPVDAGKARIRAARAHLQAHSICTRSDSRPVWHKVVT